MVFIKIKKNKKIHREECKLRLRPVADLQAEYPKIYAFLMGQMSEQSKARVKTVANWSNILPVKYSGIVHIFGFISFSIAVITTNTFWPKHQDLKDQLEYQTTKVYITSCNGDKFIVVDRLHIDKSGHRSSLRDKQRIHAHDVEQLTTVYNSKRTQVLQVALTASEPHVLESLLRLLHDLPPIHDPTREFVLVTGLIVLPDIKSPKTHRMAMKSPEASQWRLAEQAELDSMTKHEVFTHMVLPPGKKTIDTRWVYALKYKDGVIYKYKARSVAKGYELMN